MKAAHSEIVRDSISRWTAYVAVVAYVDLLFFPYFQRVIVPYSLPVVVFGLAIIGRVRFPRNTLAPLLLLAFFMVVSFGVGIFQPHSAPYAIENLKRLIQFWTSFLYLAFFFAVARDYELEKIFKYIALAFLLYFMAWLVWFIFDPAAVNAATANLYGRLVTPETVALEHLRFAYLFSDPNTAGYFLLITVLPWLTLYRGMTIRVLLLALCLVVVIFLQSRGALLALIISTALSVFPDRWLLLRFRTRDFRAVFGGASLAILIGFLGHMVVVRYFGDLPIFEMSLDRISDAEAYQRGGSRFDIWWGYASTLIPWPLGSGYMFDTVHGQFFPHSDLLRLVYSYGVIATVLFLWLFTKIGFRWPLLFVPALMAFGINSLIDEQKLFGLFFATLGVLMGIAKRRRAYAGSEAIRPVVAR